MVINILVNAGVLLIAIYVYFKLNNSTTQYLERTFKQYLFYTACVSGVGMILMYYSIVISDVRFDFRSLLFALSIRYLGWKTTLPSIVFLMSARFLWGQNSVAMLNILMSIYFIVSLPLLVRFVKKRFSKFTQLFILLTNNLVAMAFFCFILLPDYLQTFQLMIFFAAINYFLLFLCQLIMDDLSSMVSKINQDCLTNLNNQRRFHEDLEILDEVNDKVTIGILDIDHFKAYNDSFGHEVGDLVLKKVSDTLQQHTSSLVNCYRIGGEEFAMVIVGHSRLVAERMIEDLHQAIMDLEIHGITESVIRPTVSIGVAHVKADETAKAAYRRADIALYQSKNNGRNQVQVAPKSSQSFDFKIL